MKHFKHSAKWKSCVRKVKGKREKVNSFAVCTASLGRKSRVRV